MEFSSAQAIEQITWQMRLSDYPRSQDRALIDNLANGAPPYPDEEAERNGKEVNVNDLTMTRLMHEARSQLYQAFNKPGNFFTLRTDMGPVEKRNEWSVSATRLINRIMKRCSCYYENKRSKFAQLVAHGIGPSHWVNEDAWRPETLAIADVLIPSRTLLTFDNLPFFALWRSYTPAKLRKLTRDVKKGSNPGWKMDVVNQALDWADEQSGKLFSSTTFNEYWVPEKREARFKEDSGLYASDLVKTIDCWDFYFWDDAGGEEGWRRRMIFDAEGGGAGWPGRKGKTMPSQNLIGQKKGDFLFDSGNRVVAPKLSNLLHFQFADLSAVAPFRYHSVRSLGYLLYAVCHLQNRLRCAFSESVFENLMMLLRVNSLDEAERALRIQLSNRGILDPSVKFVPQSERWQPNAQLAELGMSEFKQVIADNSSSYVSNTNFSRDRVEKTKFQVMAEVNADQTLMSSALAQAYHYEKSEYEEIVRRFMRKGSLDKDVQEFQRDCKKYGLPDKMFDATYWDVAPERVMGGGNITLEQAIAQQLMEWRPAFAPGAQQEILHDAVLALTSNADKARALVPLNEGVSRTVHDATVAFGSMMAGSLVQFTRDQDELEVVQVLASELMMSVQQVMEAGGMVEPNKLEGYKNVLAQIGQLMQSLSQDKSRGPALEQVNAMVAQAANEIKGMEQRLQQMFEAQQKAQAEGGGDGKAAEVALKLEGIRMANEAKVQNMHKSHAERTAERIAQSEFHREQKEQDHQQKLRHNAEDQAMKLAATEVELKAKLKAADSNSTSPSKEA